MPSKVKEHKFLLPDIDPTALIYTHYPPQDEVKFEETVLETDDYTMIELLHDKTKGVYFFFDSHKNRVKNWVNMWDLHQNQAMPRYTTKKCWWHRDSFKTHPLGCPIAYHPNVTEGEKKDAFVAKMKEYNIESHTNDFFETEGIFCSFPCVKAYIMDMCKKNSGGRYQESCTLLMLLQYKIFGVTYEIPTAGTWKVLEDWCGHLTNEEYMQTLGKLAYEETSNIRRPYMYCSSAYIKEIKIF